MHNGYITVDNVKMSKSKGNFFTVRDIRKEYSGEVIRFFLLSGHYRGPINFSRDLMEQAKNGLARIQNCKDELIYLLSNSDVPNSDKEEEIIKGFDVYKQKFIERMDDDLNTADGISEIFELVSDINTAIRGGVSREFARKALDAIQELSDVIGILQDEQTNDIDAEVETLVAERQEARKNKDFAKADKIRDELKERGIILKDTPQGVQVIKE